jgi:tetratricopeptide (TPR) repeat protein
MGADIEPGPVFVQNVTAASGFAYGVVGADIHVFDNGRPLYLLANWQADPQADREWLRELPSRMLSARRAVVPFTGRDDEIGQLCQWRDNRPRLAVRWLHGPGGQGKTRLAAQFAAGSAAVGWKVVAAFHGPDADRPEPGSQDLSLDGAVGVLLIIDYTDRWLLTNLTWVLKNSLLHRPGIVTRVLMVARTTDAWPRVRGILDTYQAATSSHLLPALTQESGERPAMFAAARDSFAAIYGLPRIPAIAAPGPLDNPDFGLTLAVHMAALVAVDAAATSDRPAQDMADLTMYLLDREQLHWARLYDDGANAADKGQDVYRTPPEVMNQVVFTAALTGTVTRTVGAALLESLHLGPVTEQIIADHAVCYPVTDPARPGAVLEPLYPDRLAEDFLALTLPGHRADYPAQPWASATTTTLLSRQGDQHTPAPWTPRAVTFLAAAAGRWPHLGNRYLFPLLRADPQLALDAGGAALTSLATLPEVDFAVLDAITGRFPEHRHIDLDTGMAALTARVSEHGLTIISDPAVQARIHGYLSYRLHNAGLHQRALSASRNETEIWQRLTAADPAHRPDLATSLTDHASRLAQVGRSAEAVPLSEQAVDLFRELASVNRDAYLHSLAGSLQNHSIRLTEVERWAEAVPASAEALGLCRELVALDRDAYLPLLAVSVTAHADMLAKVHRLAEAVPLSLEAVDLCRELAAANRDAHLPGLADSLHNHAFRLAEAGRLAEAVPLSEEAVDVYGELAAANREAHLPRLANSVAYYALLLAQVGCLAEAVPLSQQAVDLCRELAAANRDADLADLAGSLGHHAHRLANAGRLAEAVLVSQEAVDLRRELAAFDRDAHLLELALSLSLHGVLLAGVEQWAEAVQVSQEAVDLQRELVALDRDTSLPDYVRSLAGVGQVLIESARSGEAVRPLAEAFTLCGQLPEHAQDLPDLVAELLQHAYADDPSAVAAEFRAITNQEVPAWMSAPM